MHSEEIYKSLFNLYDSFLFRKSFRDYFQKMQVDGIEAARKFWETYPYKDMFPPNTSNIFERLIEFYADLGFVPRKQYDELLKESDKIQVINSFLRETFTQLMLKIYMENGERSREIWKSSLDRQLETNKAMAKNLSELFSPSGDKIGRSLTTTVKRQEVRHKSDFAVEFALSDSGDKTVKGVVLNFSDSGLCINSPMLLQKGQKIMIMGASPTRHRGFIVRWSNDLMAGLSASA